MQHTILSLFQVGIAAKTVTGQFEVTVDGELVHSKEVLIFTNQQTNKTLVYNFTVSQNGDGFCDKPEKLEKVMDTIEQKLNEGEDDEDDEEGEDD